MKTGVLNLWWLVVFPIYLTAIMLVSFVFRRQSSTSNDYLNASLSLPTWVVTLSFLAYNCGSIEIIGMSAMAAQYGVQALHFYWIGGVPGMVFLGLVVLPVYMKTGARSFPEYLGMRFGPRVRVLNSCISMVTLTAGAGVALYALAQVLHVVVGWRLLTGAVLSALVVLIYVLVGGFRATVFTSVFQLFVMIAGLTPLLFLTVNFSTFSFALRTERWRLWQPLPLISTHATLDRFGIVFGLGFVISFSYWCTDFVMIQRALAARTVEAARRVPVLAGFGKLAFALLIVLPGAAAPALLGPTGFASFNEVMPRLMSHAFSPPLLALGAAALLASLMAGLAGHVSGFSALWTEEIYRSYIVRERSEQHYIRVGRFAVIACFFFAQAAAYVTFHFHNLMEFLQLISALFYAPTFAAVLAGFVSRRTTEKGAFAGILLGVFSAFALQVGVWTGYVHFGSQMSVNFYAAILSFSSSILCCLLYKRKELRSVRMQRQGLQPGAVTLAAMRPKRDLGALTVLLLALCLFLNLLWW